MKVTEQIDAMEASGVDPFRYLVATRVLACILMLPLLTLAADVFGIFMGWVANDCNSLSPCDCFFRMGLGTSTSATFCRRR